MEIKKYKLNNGLTVVHVPTNNNSVTVEALIKTGSVNESKNNNGISHFVEHLIFKGTKKFKTNKEITNEIEKLGGYINAYTSKDRTCFHIKILNKYFDKALDVILDIIQNPLFRKKDIENEKKVIYREIDLMLDQPHFYQWIILNKLLYKGQATSFPIYGSKKIVKSLDKKTIVDFYNKYYTPDNIIISVVGKAPNLKEKIEDKFKTKRKSAYTLKIKDKPLVRIEEFKEKKKLLSSYIIIGYKAPKRTEEYSYVFDVIQAILGKGMSGRLYENISDKKGLAYDVGSAYISEKNYAYFVVHANIERDNIEKVRELINNELKLKNITKKELEESKNFIEGNFYLTIENTEHFSDILGFWEQTSNSEELKEYIKRIKKVSIKDIKKTVFKYFSKPYAIVILEGKN